MDATTAGLVLQVITAVGALLWIAAFWFVRTRSRRPEAAQLDLGVAGPTPDLSGAQEVQGRRADIAARAAASLARGMHPAIGLVRIQASGPDTVVFQVHGLSGSRRIVKRAELHFTARGAARTEVAWSVWMEQGGGLLVGAKILLAVGLVALIAGFVLLRTFVLQSPDPNVRGQVFQMVQCVHLLWPPFLLAGLHGARARMVRTWLETLVHNLPHEAPS